MTIAEGAALVAGGFAAGIINTLAGNGSAITLSLLLATGMGGQAANATNRVGVLMQTIASVFGLRTGRRKTYLLHQGRHLYLPTVAVGSALGAWFSLQLPDAAMESIIGAVMLGLMLTLAINPKRWKRASSTLRPTSPWMRHLLFLGVGFYGGFVQMGIGLFLLAALVLLEHWSLRDANAIKLLLALVVVIPAFALFFWLGEIHWIEGGLLALGSASGATLASRYLVRDPRWEPWVRATLVVALGVGAWRTLSPYLW
jgi:uncharacterized membrane protein YfcA